MDNFIASLTNSLVCSIQYYIHARMELQSKATAGVFIFFGSNHFILYEVSDGRPFSTFHNIFGVKVSARCINADFWQYDGLLFLLSLYQYFHVLVLICHLSLISNSMNYLLLSLGKNCTLENMISHGIGVLFRRNKSKNGQKNYVK